MLPKVIYQVHELSGEYEDFCDMIVATYYDKLTATKLCEKLQQNQADDTAREQKCNNCPIYNSYVNTLEELRVVVGDYCKDCKPVTVETDWVDCDNRTLGVDSYRYIVTEVTINDAETFEQVDN